MTIKPLLALSFLAILIALSGCGGSSSSSSSYNANSQTNVAFANSSKFNYAQVSIVNSAGKETFFIDNINCTSGSTSCFINLNTNLNAGDSLIFKSASGVMVAAITAAESSSGYTALSPSAMSTGFYLVNRLSSELLAESEIDWDNFNQRTLTFFTNYDSPDGSADPYEEVGDYYASQITKTAASERTFLDAFKLRLLSWDVANNNELPNQASFTAGLYDRFWILLNKNTFSIISLAHAQSNKCSPALKKFLSLAGNLGKVIPVVGEGVAGTAKLGSSYCDGSGDQLTQMVSQLNDIQNSVNKIASNLGALSKFLFDQTANDKTAEFEKTAKEAQALSVRYNTFLRNNGNVQSLQEFFVKQGSWANGIKVGGAALANILNSPYSSITNKGLYTSISDVTSFATYNSYLQSLKSRCDQLNTSSKDNFIVTRQQCNNIILANSAMLVAAQGIALPIFKDIYTTLNTYPEAKNAVSLPLGLTSYATAYAETEAGFSDQQSKMIEQYKNSISPIGFFDAFAGLDTSLVTALTSRQCNQNDVDRSNSPAIIGWYALDVNDKKNYIETACKLGVGWSQRVNARYFYNDQGAGATPSNIANVLGVPIAAIYLENDRPLANSQANISSESFIYNQTAGSLLLDAPSVRVFGKGTSTGGVLSPTTLAKSPNGYYVLPYGEIVWLTVPTKDLKKWYVAKIKIITRQQDPLIISQLSCETKPCRVDPNNNNLGLWLEGESTGLKLDLVDKDEFPTGGKLLRLETR